jgi:hypothetical protein
MGSESPIQPSSGGSGFGRQSYIAPSTSRIICALTSLKSLQLPFLFCSSICVDWIVILAQPFAPWLRDIDPRTSLSVEDTSTHLGWRLTKSSKCRARRPIQRELV